MVPRFQNFSRPCSRRALSLCFAALLCAGGLNVAHSQAIRRMPNALIPAPGGTDALTRTFRTLHTAPAVLSNADHPLFDTSYYGDENQVLATTRYGNVTSRDLYLWMLMTDSSNKPYLAQLLQEARFPAEKKQLSEELRVEVDNFVFHNYIIPRIMPAAPVDPVYDFKHYVYTLPAWQTVFLQRVVRPGVTITQADRQKYLQEHTAELAEPQRLRTRYIFMRSPETAPGEDQNRVEVAMDELRASILRGEISFADAARQHSHAPSASRGGEIPPFQHGELFFLFENAAAELEPGEISRIFRGPNGLYMVQLIEVIEPEEPNLSNPRHARKVEEGLSRQVLRAAYQIYMRDMLFERRRLVEKTWAWDDLEEDEILGSVCEFDICKSQMRSAFPQIEGNDLKLNFELMALMLRLTLEREAMAQEVRALGCDTDPMLERARWMAGNLVRRDAWMDQLRASLPISEDIVRRFWQDHPDLFTPLALKRVIRLTMRPSNTVPLPAQTRMELDQVLAQATGQPMVLPLEERVVTDEEKHGLVQDVQQRTERAFEMLTSPSSEPDYYSEDYSTEALDAIIDSGATDDSIPSLDGQSAPGFDPIPAPSSISTSTLESLVPRQPALSDESDDADVDTASDAATTATILDISTTATQPRGGASPTPVAGGIRPVVVVNDVEEGAPITAHDVRMVGPSTAPTPTPTTPEERASSEAAAIEQSEQDAGTPVQGVSRPARPATTPTGGRVPIGITAPAIAPGVELQPTPNPENQLKPPQTSSIPYNPHWFYGRLTPTEIAAVVGHYASSDWLLTMDDLGFVYTPDVPDAPRNLEQVPVGAFSRPVLRGEQAVSWYIEDARKVEKPPFEAIKTQVYDTYRSVQLDKAVADKYNAELEKARIDYKF